jgi:NAD/NADP transhydrogenase beta subunit
VGQSGLRTKKAEPLLTLTLPTKLTGYNPLFAAPNALMLYGDGKEMVRELTAALKEE